MAVEFIPESARIDIRVYPVEESRLIPLPNGRTRQRGTLLRDLIERFGGLEGSATDPFGHPHPVSLAPWADADPDGTIVEIAFKMVRRNPPPPRDPSKRPAIFTGVRPVAFQEGDPHYSYVDPDGKRRTYGVPLRMIRAQIGGDEGTVTDPNGANHHLSLAPWANADPDRTYISLAFESELDQRTDQD